MLLGMGIRERTAFLTLLQKPGAAGGSAAGSAIYAGGESRGKRAVGVIEVYEVARPGSMGVTEDWQVLFKATYAARESYGSSQWL
jgi:hypothetical protein